ncbi:Tyrosine recombinase XerC [subsurface metagenome]
MDTKEALTRFLKNCEERGLSPDTRRVYHTYLRHFADEYPDLPTDTKIIELFLKKRKETPAHRGPVFQKLQAFYTYLKAAGIIDKSPVPPKGPMGRPPKFKKVVENPGTGQLEIATSLYPEKVGKGGTIVLPSGSTSTSISTAEAVEAFIRSKKAQNVSPRTIESYAKYKPFIRKYPILPLTVEPIEEFLGSIQGVPETRWTYRKHLIALYHFLEERKKIPKDLFKFPPARIPKKVRRVLSEDELRRLFLYAQNFTEKAILTLLIDSKIRAGELDSLTREKVYPDHITVAGKTGQRDVPIKPETYDMLVQLAASGPLFRFEGRPIRREYLRIIIRRLMHRAGLTGKKLGPHILRHSASKAHMVHGGDLLSLKEELGHTTTKMTEIYGQLALEDVKRKHQTVDVLGHILNREPLNHPPMERASCYGCKTEVLLELAKVKEVKCPGCGLVGKWYLPNHQGGVTTRPKGWRPSLAGGAKIEDRRSHRNHQGGMILCKSCSHSKESCPLYGMTDGMDEPLYGQMVDCIHYQQGELSTSYQQGVEDGEG